MSSNWLGGNGSPFPTSVKKKQPKNPQNFFQKAAHYANPAAGLVENLATDVFDAAVGLPGGLILTAKDPIGVAKAVAMSEWETWSPLAHGDIKGFATGVYHHPLAPILDVATIFSLGLGAVAKGAVLASGAGRVAELGAGAAAVTKTEKLASLTLPKSVVLEDPLKLSHNVDDVARAGHDLNRPLSTRPMRRLAQEGIIALDQGGHLPQFYVKTRYARQRLISDTHKAAATVGVKAAALKSGEAIERAVEGNHQDKLANAAGQYRLPPEYHSLPGIPEAGIAVQASLYAKGGELLLNASVLGSRARSTIFSHMFSGLVLHNVAMNADEAARLLKTKTHRYVVDPAYVRGGYHDNVQFREAEHSALTRKRGDTQTKWTPKRDRLAAQEADLRSAGMGIDQTRQDIARINEELQHVANAGNVVEGGARFKSGPRKGQVIPDPNPNQLMRYTSEYRHGLQEQQKTLQAKLDRAEGAKRIHDSGVVQAELKHANDKLTSWDADILAAESTLNKAVDMNVSRFFDHLSNDPAKFDQNVLNFAGYVLTKDPARALKTQDGKVHVALMSEARKVGREAHGSSRMLKQIWRAPTSVWKWLVVGAAPRTVVNNAVGNWLMYVARHPGVNGMTSIYHGLKFAVGDRFVDDLAAATYRSNHWIHEYHMPEMVDTMGTGLGLERDITAISHGLPKYQKSLKDRGREGFYPVVRATSETPVKAAALYQSYRTMPLVKAELKAAHASGMRGTTALDTAIRRALKKDPSLAEHASLNSRRVAGDYITKATVERFMTDVMPFYLWQRHILKTTGNMLLDSPGRITLMSQLSEQGLEATKSYLGDVPHYLSGAIPLAMLGLGDSPGRANIITTSGLNPWATVAEQAKTVDAWIGSGGSSRGDKIAALSGFNPFLTSAFSAITSTNPLTGIPLSHTGNSVLVDVLEQTIANVPEFAALEKTLNPDRNPFLTAKGGHRLYASRPSDKWLGIVGVPHKDVSRGALVKLANRAKRAEQTAQGG